MQTNSTISATLQDRHVKKKLIYDKEYDLRVTVSIIGVAKFDKERNSFMWTLRTRITGETNYFTSLKLLGIYQLIY